MTQQTINVGTTANDGTGDNLRSAGQKINANFTELYNGSTPGAVLAQQWASLVGAFVTGTSLSAYEWAVGTFKRGVAGFGSAKDWASYIGGTVDDTEYSAKKYANDSAASLAASLQMQVRVITATTYALVAGDSGYELQFPNGCTVTLPNSLATTFLCGLQRTGSTDVTCSFASGATAADGDTSRFRTWFAGDIVAVEVMLNSGGSSAVYALGNRTPTSDEIAAAVARQSLLTMPNNDTSAITTLASTNVGEFRYYPSDASLTLPNTLSVGFDWAFLTALNKSLTLTPAAGATLYVDGVSVTSVVLTGSSMLAVRANVDGVSAIYEIRTGGTGIYVAGTGLTLRGNTFAIDSTVLTTATKAVFSNRVDATISADQNNYSPTGFATAAAVFIDGGASDRNITGLLAGTEGRLVWLVNKGTTNSLILKNQSASSSAANKFLFPGDVALAVNTSLALRYDATASVWRPASRALADSGVTAGSYTNSNITVDRQGRVTSAANGSAQVGPVLLGYALNVDFNATGDTVVALTLPTGCTKWAGLQGFLYGVSGTFGTAKAGIYSAASQGGQALIAQTLTSLTAVGPNNSGNRSTGWGSGSGEVQDYTTLYLNVGTLQGNAAVANFYLFGYPLP